MSNPTWVKEILDIVSQQGKFPLGLVVGIVIGIGAMYLSERIASKERREQRKLDLEREKVQQDQLKERDQRISRLHDQLDRVVKEKDAVKRSAV